MAKKTQRMLLYWQLQKLEYFYLKNERLKNRIQKIIFKSKVATVKRTYDRLLFLYDHG